MTDIFKLSQLHKSYAILLCIVAVNFLLAYPGIMSSDSIGQYEMAKSGVFSDHHPALMSYVWGYLDKLVEGSGLMLGLHFALMFVGLCYGIRSFKNSNLRYFFIIFPIIPQISVYSFMIWKDVGFAFSFLFCAMMLANSIMEKRRLKIYEHCAFWTVLLYGTAVKFQAQYCAPILIFFYVYSQVALANNLLKLFVTGLLACLFFFTVLIFINNALVPNQTKSHSWQMVKLYDMAAIGVDTGDIMIPEKFRTKYYSDDQLHKRFNHQSVDDMIFGNDPIFVSGKTEEDRQQLWNAWFESIKKHPLSYLKHRFLNLNYALTLFPGHKQVEVLISRFFEKFRGLIPNEFISTFLDENNVIFKVTKWSVNLVLFVFVGNSFVVLLGLIYLFFALNNFKRDEAKVLFMLSSVGLAMILALFFFSMAGTSRYTYIVMCMVHASHAFFFMNCKAIRNVKE